jgi:hypothetical protein
MGLNGASLSEDLITEVCRFAGAEIHPVAAFIGGMASQEVIKVCYLFFAEVYPGVCCLCSHGAFVANKHFSPFSSW